MNPENIYPRTNDHETVYLKNVIKNLNNPCLGVYHV